MKYPISKMEKLKSLKNGKGVQYLLNKAYEILENPILTHDMEYKLIACTENIITDDPIWNEFVTTGTVSRERLEFYKNEKFFDTAANAKKITFLTSDKLKYNRIYGKLFNSDNIQVGCAVIKESHKPFEYDDRDLFECICDILNRELAMSEFFRNYGQDYQETLINKLIEGNIDDKQIYTAHVESIYINLKDNIYLAVADITHADPAHAKLTYFKDLFKSAQPAFKYSTYDNYIIIIISSDNPSLDLKKDLAKLKKIFKQNNIRIGISSCFDNLFELRKYYLEAVVALNDGQKKDRAF